MYQVLFTLPLQKLPLVGGWFPPDGAPVSTFGAMLFLAAVLGTAWATRRGARAGMPGPRVQDMVIVIFLGGLVGARILYMIQYRHQFPNPLEKPVDWLFAFLQIWKGGIIFYGSVAGGVIAYLVFYRVVIRRLEPRVSVWQLADAVAPVLALGLALGRIGCYLNGCCWGQAAVPEACPVPLGGAHFPLLPALGRDQLVKDQRVQTSAGFTVVPPGRAWADPRAVVGAVEPGSGAEAAGLRAGDKVVAVNGRPNGAVVEVLGGAEERARAVAALTAEGGREEPTASEKASKVVFDDWGKAADGAAAARQAAPGATLIESDTLADAVRDWPRARHDLALKVARPKGEVELPAFEPRTVPLYPTQLYETLSMLLLIPLLLALYPFRRHDGQLMTVCMTAYAVHRFVNESLRVEPAVGLGLTLSQWGSVLILAAAVGIELYLRRTQPSRWAAKPGPVPGERGASAP